MSAIDPGSTAPTPRTAVAPASLAPARSLRRWLAAGRPQALLTLPFIYGLALPLVLLDLSFALYQAASFPMYRIAKVRRRDYFVLDRARLPYLNPIEKVHCAYCSYANAVLAYVREIAARTEQYWCPIKHRRQPAGEHDRYGAFLAYGDAAGFDARTQQLRRSLAADDALPVDATDTRNAVA